MNEEEAYEHAYEVIANGEFGEVADVVQQHVESDGRDAAYNDVFTGEPQNLVQDVLEYAPVEVEEDGALLHSWAAGAFDALLAEY